MEHMEHMEHMGCLSGHAVRLVTCHSAFLEPQRHAGLAAAGAYQPVYAAAVSLWARG